MQVYIFVSLFVALFGAGTYLLRKAPGDRWAELGRLAFVAGLFVFLMQWGPHLVGKG